MTWRNPRTWPWPVVALAVLWVGLAGALAMRVRGQTVDDFFITFRYAENLLAGEGFVFNPGERVFGTTAPGWGLVLAGLAGLCGEAVAVVATFTSAACLVGLALLLLAAAGPARRFEAALAGSLVLTSAYLWVHNGSESFALLLVLAGAARLGPERPVLAGLLLGYGVWLRPEALLAVPLLVGMLFWEERRLAWRLGLAAGGAISGGLAAAWFWFGTALPNTLGAKRLQSSLQPEIWHGGLAFWQEAYVWVGAAYAGPWIGVLVVGGLLGQLSILRGWASDRRLRPLALLSFFAFALVVAYPLLGVPFYTWYAIPVLIPWLYGFCFLAFDLGRLTWRRLPPRWLAGTAVALVVAGTLPLAVHVSLRVWSGYRAFAGIPQIELYQAAGQWLRANTGKDEAVAHVEVGALASASDRPVRDLLGLVSPELLPALARGGVTGAFLARPAELVVDHSRLAGFSAPFLAEPWFQAAYEPVATFKAKLSADVLVLYRRRPGAVLPAAPTNP